MNNTEEPQFEIRVIRLNESTKDVNGKEIKFTTKILIHIFLWTRFRKLKLDLVSLEYKEDIVDLKLKFNTNSLTPFRTPYPSVCEVEIGKEEDDEILIDQEIIFNNSDNNILLVTLHDVPTEERPLGKRRKVVIYEDTDIIDSGINPFI